MITLGCHSTHASRITKLMCLMLKQLRTCAVLLPSPVHSFVVAQIELIKSVIYKYLRVFFTRCSREKLGTVTAKMRQITPVIVFVLLAMHYTRIESREPVRVKHQKLQASIFGLERLATSRTVRISLL